MQEAVGTVSGQFPNIHFAIIDGAGTDSKGTDLKHSNVQSLFFKEQDAGAMVGVIAGWLEKTGKAKNTKHVVGAVGGISIPPVNHYIAGYKWAAKMEDPSIQVLVGYSNNFTDPAKCAGVATSQINQGADVLFQVAGGCGLGVLQSAGKASVYSIGVDADQKDADPSVIASALKKVDVATYTAIHNVVQGQFQGGALTFSIANEGAGYAVDNFDLPADLKAELEKVQGQIKSGFLTPLITTGVAVALPFRAGLFNIGAEGQLIAGAIACTAIGVKFSGLPSPILLPMVLLGGMAAGALWAGIAGLLKATVGAHEVVTTIMLNYVAQWLLRYLIIGGPLQLREGTSTSLPIGHGARLPTLLPSDNSLIIFGLPAVVSRVPAV